MLTIPKGSTPNQTQNAQKVIDLLKTVEMTAEIFSELGVAFMGCAAFKLTPEQFDEILAYAIKGVVAFNEKLPRK